MIGCVVVDPLAEAGADLSGLDEGIELRPTTDPLDIAPWAAHEVLLVSADPERLAAAAALGLNRLVATSPEATAAAVEEMCRELDRP